VPNSEPFSGFNLFFDDDLFKNIVTWINLRANSVINKEHSRYSNLNRWHNIDVDELNQFLGLSIVMGYLKFSSLGTYYWSKFELDSHQIFGKTISHHRYEFILRFLCFSIILDPYPYPR